MAHQRAARLTGTRAAGCRSAGMRLGTVLFALILATHVAMHGCGFLGSKGEEPRGDASLPVSGVGPFLKEDQDCEQDFLQSVFMDSGDRSVYWGEPWLMHMEGTRFRVFFEARGGRRVNIYEQCLEIAPAPPGSCRSRDILFVSGQGRYLAEPSPVLVLENAGAPSVLYDHGIFKIWYETQGRGGIGYAEVVEGGQGGFETISRAEPVLRPTESWEAGFVGSPSVLFDSDRMTYRMWYEGDLFGQRSIGYAVSSDGTSWVKQDTLGRDSIHDPGDVAPLVWPTQTTWEFHYPSEADSGSIGTPHVILHRTPVRTLYYLYYTGNLKGRAQLNLDDVDTSIGLAGSEDGLHWVKASTLQEFGTVAWEVNPILNEVFPLDVVNKLFAELLGQGYKYKIQGSSNVFFPFVIVDEVAPSVLDMGQFFYMVFEQVGGLDQSKGLALAVLERKER